MAERGHRDTPHEESPDHADVAGSSSPQTQGRTSQPDASVTGAGAEAAGGITAAGGYVEGRTAEQPDRTTQKVGDEGTRAAADPPG